MTTRPVAGYAVIAALALAFGFLLASQLRVQLTPNNALARNQALVRTVRDLEKQNAGYRGQVASLRQDVHGLEADAARRSETTHRLEQEVEGLRLAAGLTPMHGPGVVVELSGGRPGPLPQQPTSGWLVNYQDIQDLVQVLYEGGAEGVAVNGRRITPASSFTGSGTAVVIDQGPPLSSAFRVAAVGNRNQMEQVLSDPGRLGDLRNRQRQYGLQLSWTGRPDLVLPAYDAVVQVTHARPA